MKILVISDYGNNPHIHRPEVEALLGLRQEYTVELAFATNAQSHHGKDLIEAGLKVYDFVPDKKISGSAIKRIKEMVAEYKPDIVYAVNNNAISNSIRALKKSEIKLISYRGAGKIYWHDPTYYLTHLNPRIDATICLSNAVEKVVKKQNWYRKINTFVAYKGQRKEWFQGVESADLDELGIPRNAFVVGKVANLRKTKGFDYFINSANYLPKGLPIYYVLVGLGTDSDLMKQLSKESNYKKNIKLLGHRKDILPLTKSFSATVLASTKIEGLGKTVMESMALGVPPIVTDTGGPTELVENGDSGLIIAPRDAKAIAEAIMYLYNNYDKRLEMGLKAQKRLFEKFTVENNTKALYNAFYKILHGKSPYKNVL